MSNAAVLDTSAILAVVLREPGSDVVQAVKERRVVSAVNAAEVCAKLIEKGFELRAFDAVMQRLDVLVDSFDAEQARLSGELRRTTKHLGLSLGDRACLALGMVKSAIVYTADQAWANVDLPIEIKLVR